MPDPRLPNDIDAVVDITPAWPRGLPELRQQLASLPPLTPGALPGINPAMFPEDDGTVASTGSGATGSTSGTLTTGEAPGSTPGTAITPHTLPREVLAPSVRPVIVVPSLPTLPDANYPTGSFVYNMGDTPYALYRTNDGLAWTKAIDANDIVANSITAGQISVGAIGVDELASKIVLAGSIICGVDGGARLELDSSGGTLYDSNSNPVVRLPTNGSAVWVKGEIEASTLTSTTSAELGGSTLIPANATVTFAAGVVAPTAAPVLTQELYASQVLASGTQFTNAATGAAWDASAGTVWVARQNDSGNIDVLECNPSTGAVVRTLSTGHAWATYGFFGVAVSGSYIYVGGDDGATATVWKYNKSTLAYVTSFTVSVASHGDYRWRIFWDGTYVVVVTVDTVGTSGKIRFRRYTEAGSLNSTVTDTLFTANFANDYIFGACSDGTNYWIAYHGPATSYPNYVRKFNGSTGAYIADAEFGYVGTTSYANGGIAHDGTRFRGFWLNNGAGTLVSFTNWDWTTASSVYWVGYSWYDPDGTTHETQLGPIASVTMYRRMALRVQNAAIPGGGGADDPDNVRVYMAPNASKPAAGNYKLQATDALTARVFTDYASGGAADSTTNGFASIANPAKILGLNLINRTGTTFPASPATNDTFFRSDLGMEFFYDGSRWVSTTLYEQRISDISNISVDTADAARAVPPSACGGSDIWVVSFWPGGVNIGAGTALSGSHKWDVNFQYYDGTFHALGSTYSINSGANGWRRGVQQTVNTLLGTSAIFMGVNAQVTGTPGNLYLYSSFTYRIVAT